MSVPSTAVHRKSTPEVQALLDEMKRLAQQVAQAQGYNCALVMISGTDEDYGDVIPELITEDAFRVEPHGWPQGFSITLLNPSD